MRNRLSIIAAAATLSTFGMAQNATYSASVDGGVYDNQTAYSDSTTTGGQILTDGFTDTTGSSNGYAQANNLDGSLHVATGSQVPLNAGISTSNAYASTTGQISLTNNNGQSTTETQLNLALDGSIILHDINDFSTISGANAGLDISLQVVQNGNTLFNDTLEVSGYNGGESTGDGQTSFSYLSEITNGVGFSQYAGSAANQAVDWGNANIADIYTNPFLIGTGSATVALSIQAQTSSNSIDYYTSGGTAQATMSFQNTFSFASTVPAFTIGSGWDVNSVDYNIIHNKYQAVPSPAGMIAFAPLALFIFRKRK